MVHLALAAQTMIRFKITIIYDIATETKLCYLVFVLLLDSDSIGASVFEPGIEKGETHVSPS